MCIYVDITSLIVVCVCVLFLQRQCALSSSYIDKRSKYICIYNIVYRIYVYSMYIYFLCNLYVNTIFIFVGFFFFSFCFCLTFILHTEYVKSEINNKF